MENNIKQKIITLTLNPSLDQIFIINNLKINDVNSCSSFYQIAAGKGINVSKYLKTIGVDSNIFGFLCLNAETIFQNQLKLLDINTHFLSIEGELRINTTIIDEINKTSTHLKSKGFKLKNHQLQLMLTNLENHLSPFDFLLICGSYPEDFDFSLFNSYLENMHSKNIRIYIDNDGQNLRKIKNICNYFIKPNLKEFEDYLNLKISSVSELILYLKKNDSFKKYPILITLGEEGIIYFGDEGLIQCKLTPVKIVSTIGCGDAVLAGFIYGKIKNESIENCLKFAVAFAVDKIGNEFVGIINPKNIPILKENAELLYY